MKHQVPVERKLASKEVQIEVQVIILVGNDFQPILCNAIASIGFPPGMTLFTAHVEIVYNAH